MDKGVQYLREAPPINRRNLVRNRDDNEGVVGGGFRNRRRYASSSSAYSSMRYDPDIRAIGEEPSGGNEFMRHEKKVEKAQEYQLPLPFMKLVDFFSYPQFKIDIQLKLRVISSPIPYIWYIMSIITILNKLAPPGDFFRLSQVSYWSMLLICCVIAYGMGVLISYLLRASTLNAKLDMHNLSAWVITVVAGLAAMFHHAFEFDGEIIFALTPFSTFFVCMYLSTAFDYYDEEERPFDEEVSTFTGTQFFFWALLWNTILYLAVTVVFYCAQRFGGIEVYHLTPTAAFIVATYVAENIFRTSHAVVIRASFMALIYTAFILTIFESFFYFPMLFLTLGSCLSIEDTKQRRKTAKRLIGDTLKIVRERLEEGNVSIGDVRKIFAAIDEDGDRVINRWEFKSAMKKLQIPIDSDTVENIYLVFDNDDNGIDYDEFLDIFSYEKEKKNEYYGGFVQNPEEIWKSQQRRRMMM